MISARQKACHVLDPPRHSYATSQPTPRAATLIAEMTAGMVLTLVFATGIPARLMEVEQIAEPIEQMLPWAGAAGPRVMISYRCWPPPC